MKKQTTIQDLLEVYGSDQIDSLIDQLKCSISDLLKVWHEFESFEKELLLSEVFVEFPNFFKLTDLSIEDLHKLLDVLKYQPSVLEDILQKRTFAKLDIFIPDENSKLLGIPDKYYEMWYLPISHRLALFVQGALQGNTEYLVDSNTFKVFSNYLLSTLPQSLGLFISIDSDKPLHRLDIYERFASDDEASGYVRGCVEMGRVGLSTGVDRNAYVEILLYNYWYRFSVDRVFRDSIISRLNLIDRDNNFGGSYTPDWL